MPNWSDDNGNCHFEVNGVPCYESPDKCPMHGGSWGNHSKTKKPTKTTTELTRLRRENADMARALDDAIEIQKKAVADAFKRGAEAMRKAAAKACDDEAMDHRQSGRTTDDYRAFGAYLAAARVEALPIPEDQ